MEYWDDVPQWNFRTMPMNTHSITWDSKTIKTIEMVGHKLHMIVIVIIKNREIVIVKSGKKEGDHYFVC